MKSFAFPHRRILVHAGLCLIPLLSRTFAQDSSGIAFSGAGWMQYNVIGSSSLNNNRFDGKSILSTGAQVSLSDKISDRLRVTAGLGVVTGNTLPQSPSSNSGYALAATDAYVSEADFTYRLWKRDNSKAWLRGGLFPYTYNPDVKDLGLYLLRGPVHPGLLVSGTESQGVMPVANMTGLPVANVTGLQLHHEWGNFQGDLLIASETQYYPFFDISPAYVAGYQIVPALHVGAGVNFYHLFAADRKLTRDPQYYDNADSSSITFAGTKLMANAAFDPKPLMPANAALGPEDLKLYGEIALIGLEDGKAYRRIYGSYSRRIPVMIGFNAPAFNYLDHLSLEVEWYGARFNDDMSGYNQNYYTPYPVGYNPSAPSRVTRDNWKWSVHAAKTVQTHIRVTVQVADDHYRPGIYVGYGDSNPPIRQAVLVTPKDWYASGKFEYLF